MTFDEFVNKYGIDKLVSMIRNNEEVYVINMGICIYKCALTGIIQHNDIAFQYNWHFVTRRIFLTEDSAEKFFNEFYEK